MTICLYNTSSTVSSQLTTYEKKIFITYLQTNIIYHMYLIHELKISHYKNIPSLYINYLIEDHKIYTQTVIYFYYFKHYNIHIYYTHNKQYQNLIFQRSFIIHCYYQMRKLRFVPYHLFLIHHYFFYRLQIIQILDLFYHHLLLHVSSHPLNVFKQYSYMVRIKYLD